MQYEVYGYLPNSMILYQLFAFIYMIDFAFFEPLCLYMWDIIAEKCVSTVLNGRYLLIIMPVWG